MVASTLRDGVINEPIISAQNNMPLYFEVADRVETKCSSLRLSLRAARASTSDDWNVEVIEYHSKAFLTFSDGYREVKSADLNWKSMADLTVKQHANAAFRTKFDLVNGSYKDGMTFPVCQADASQACGYKTLGRSAITPYLWVMCDEAGNFSLVQDGNTILIAGVGNSTGAAAQLANMIAAMLAATTETTFSADSTYILESLDDDLTFEISTAITLKEIAGTESITIGNYTNGRQSIRLDCPAAGGNDRFVSIKTVKEDAAFTVPSVQLDQMRRAAKAQTYPTMRVTFADEDVSAEQSWGSANVASTENIIGRASLNDPNGVTEYGFDQSNSMNVLAAAAFAGLAGLASVGVATELRTLLANSPLSTLFQNVALALGVTTAGVISGYVSALIAAYTNGWITNEQLFSLEQHIAWLRAGSRILALGTTGALVGGSLAGVFNYLGVSSQILPNLATGAIEAASGAGIALGMAAVMAKVIRHRYVGD